MNKIIIFSMLILVSGFYINDAFAQNSHLRVSAEYENPDHRFDNHIWGPQVIEIKILGDEDETTSVHDEPDVTYNGKKIRMAQGLDGNWYAYIASRDFSQNADATVVVEGKGLDYGEFCSPNTSSSILGIDVSETSGIAIPSKITGTTDSTNGISSFVSCDGTISSQIKNHVVREPVALNVLSGNIGQIGLKENLWPFIQLYDFNPTGNIVIQYNTNQGVQTSTMTYDDSFPYLEGFGTFPSLTEIDLNIFSNELNIDPTDEDSWTFTTSSGNYGIYYQAFDENGNADADGTSGMVNLKNNLSLLYGDTAIADYVLELKPGVKGNPPYILQDNGIQILNSDESTSSLDSTLQPITFVEDASSSNNFVNTDSTGKSNLMTGNYLNLTADSCRFTLGFDYLGNSGKCIGIKELPPPEFDRTVYPVPIEGVPIIIYISTTENVEIFTTPHLQLLGTTDTGKFIINHDDYDITEGVGILLSYLGETFDASSFDERNAVLKLDKSVYNVDEIVILEIIEPDRNGDSKNIETYSPKIIQWSSNAGTLPLSDPIFESSDLIEIPFGTSSSAENTGIFQMTFKIPNKIPTNTIFNNERITLTYLDNRWQVPREIQFTVLSDESSPTTTTSTDSEIIVCGTGTYLVDGSCKPRPDQVDTSSTMTLTSSTPKLVNTNNEYVSQPKVGDTLFINTEIENLGSNTEDFVVSYRYLASSVGDWSEWTWVSSSINAGKYSDVAIPWNPTKADNYEFDIQIWDNVLERKIITTEKLVVTVKSASITSPTTTNSMTPQTTTEQTMTKPKPSFVDETKDPQHYVDRYNNEQTYREWFDENFPDYTIYEAVGLSEPAKEKVPGWIKNNAKWWSEDQVDDRTFVNGIGFLIKEKIIGITDLPEQSSETIEEKVPDWVKNNAKWWADGLISEDEFIKGIEFLVENRILRVN